MNEMKPEIRFEGFEEEWEKYKLKEVSDIKRGASPRPIESPIWFDDSSEVGWLRISDVTFQNGRIEHVKQRLSTKGQEKTRILKDKHLILSIAATVGKPVINYVEIGIHDGFIVFEKPKFNIEFLFHFLEKYRPEWNKYGQPGSQININTNLVKELDVYLPTIKEQVRIGQYFDKIDKHIDLKQKELNKLKQFKQAMLQKMFPKEGETIPEIRFEGFDNPWEPFKLDSISTSYSGGTPNIGNKNYYNGNIPFVRSGEIGKNNTEIHISDEGIQNSSAKLVTKGTILYALYGATSGEVSISKINGAINQAILAIEPDNTFDPLIISYLLKRNKNAIIDKYLQGGQGNLSGNIIRNLILYLPNDIQEQAKIGEYFNKLDKQITNKQKELDKSNHFKQAMLDKMFV